MKFRIVTSLFCSLFLMACATTPKRATPWIAQKNAEKAEMQELIEGLEKIQKKIEAENKKERQINEMLKQGLNRQQAIYELQRKESRHPHHHHHHQWHLQQQQLEQQRIFQQNMENDMLQQWRFQQDVNRQIEQQQQHQFQYFNQHNNF